MGQSVEAALDERIDPYACAWFANQVDPQDYDEEIERRLNAPPAEGEPDHRYNVCILAELMKRTGDSRAERFYQKSINLNPDEPAFELFYADYLLFVRGVRDGLVVGASKHYSRAREKIAYMQAQGEVGGKKRRTYSSRSPTRPLLCVSSRRHTTDICRCRTGSVLQYHQ